MWARVARGGALGIAGGVSRVSRLHALRPVQPRRSIFQLLTPPERVTYADARAVPFTALQVFEVVADVNQYKHFVPFCVDSRVLRNYGRAIQRVRGLKRGDNL
jgi:hypothetical protein